MLVLQTERLKLRWLTLDDAELILALLNDADFIRYVGDRGVRTVEAAREYISKGPIASYNRHGFGLYLVELKGTGTPIGICGLVKRETLTDIDIGFGFLPPYRSQGYAVEAAAAVLVHGREDVGLNRIVAITANDNDRSVNVLEKIGLRFEKMIKLVDEDTPIRLYAWTATRGR